jgi:hypothetical protein
MSTLESKSFYVLQFVRAQKWSPLVQNVETPIPEDLHFATSAVLRQLVAIFWKLNALKLPTITCTCIILSRWYHVCSYSLLIEMQLTESIFWRFFSRNPLGPLEKRSKNDYYRKWKQKQTPRLLFSSCSSLWYIRKRRKSYIEQVIKRLNDSSHPRT